MCEARIRRAIKQGRVTRCITDRIPILTLQKTLNSFEVGIGLLAVG